MSGDRAARAGFRRPWGDKLGGRRQQRGCDDYQDGQGDWSINCMSSTTESSVQQAKANMKDVATLLDRIESLTRRLGPWCQPNTTVPQGVVEHITRLLEYVLFCHCRYTPVIRCHRAWNDICDDAIEIKSQSRCIQLIRGSSDAGKISEMIRRFSGSMIECTVSETATRR